MNIQPNLTAVIDLENLVNKSPNPHLYHDNIKEVNNYYSNGLSKFINKVHIEIITDHQKCKYLWNKYYPQKSLFDTWNFRYSFHKAYKMDPLFYVLKRHDEILAILPLCKNPYTQRYSWFGSDWCEDSKFITIHPNYISILMLLAPRPLYLGCLEPDQIKNFPDFIEFKQDDPKFRVDLYDSKNLNDFLKRYKKKRRYNFKRDIRIVELQKPKIHINRFKDYEEIAAICKSNFNRKGIKADWEKEPAIIQTFRNVIKDSNNVYTPRMMSVEINREIVAVDLLCIYKGVYYALKGGYKTQKYPGIGNYMNLIEIQDAINLGINKMDFLAENYGWKDKWFEETPLFMYKEGYPEE